MPRTTRSPAWIRTLPVLVVAGFLAAYWWWAGGTAVDPALDPSVSPDRLSAEHRERTAAVATADVSELLLHATDADWRVRAAAYARMNAIAALGTTPARDTPMAQREAAVLAWFDRHHSVSGDALCELFAYAPYAQYGTTLAARCLDCHAGPHPTPRLASTGCADCHSEIHAAWDRSAHANSLSHLRLPTIDPVTRQTGWLGFGEQRGMSCVACHRAAGDHERCLAAFVARSCADCHTEIEASWQRWRDGPRPRRLDWPPGAIAFEADDRTRSCIDCHMPAGTHGFSARRDMGLLRGGLDVSLVSLSDDAWAIRLTNLAGHQYPAGTTRRALEVYVTLDGGEETLLATLSPAGVVEASLGEQFEISGGALQPGEQRDLILDDARDRVRCRVVYVRDRFDPESYRVVIQSLDQRMPGR